MSIWGPTHHVDTEPLPLRLARDRDAFAVIGGFAYQVDITIKRWLELGAEEMLVLESGEDIDRFSGALDGAITLEQVKSRSSSVTLRDPGARAAIASFLEHREQNHGRQVQFVFTTTAEVGMETPSSLSEAGITIWERVRTGELPEPQLAPSLVAIRALVSDHAPAGVSGSTWANAVRFLEDPSTDLLSVVRSFTWSTRAPRSLEVERETRRALEERFGYDSYPYLFLHVWRLLSQRGLKRLTAAQLERAAEDGKTEASQHFVQRVVQPLVAMFEGRFENVERRLDVLEAQTTIDADADRRALLAEWRSQDGDRSPLGGLAEVRMRMRDVRVPVRLVAGPPASPSSFVDRSVVDLLERGTVHEPVMVRLFGAVGSGKSEALAALAASLANAAESDAERPLPLVLPMRHLCESPWQDVVRTLYPAAAAACERLVGGQSAKWVLLLDGCDEASGDASRIIQSVVRTFDGRLCGVVASSRPSVRPRLERSTDVWLSPWTDDDVRRFKERWVVHDPGAVRRLDALRSRSIADLMRNPLTASLCLLVVSDDVNLGSRAALFDAVVARLVSDWAATRPELGFTARWRELASAMRILALEYVRKGAAGISASELDAALRAAAGDGAREFARTAERHLGLLVRHGDRYDFAIRAIAEFLAGQALAEREPAVLATTSRAVWAAEPVRHAVGCAALQSPGAAVERLRALVAGEEDDTPGRSDGHLRPVIVATLAAADLGELAAPVAAPLAHAVARRVGDEQSVWVGDVMAHAARELAAAGGPCWDALEPQLTRSLLAGGHRADWCAAQDWPETTRWVEVLYERDPRVRGVAIDRLGARAHEQLASNALHVMLFDGHTHAFSQPPAVAAGLALRQARSRGVQLQLEVISRLWLHDRGQLGAHVIAAVVDPDECPEADRIRDALRSGNVYDLPLAVLATWGVAADETPSMAVPLEPADAGHPPPSAPVRARIAGVLGPALSRLELPVRARFADGRSPAALEVLCETAFEHPELLTDLPTSGALFRLVFTGVAEDHLARAAVRHPSVRRWLLALWADRAEGTAIRYPGRSLEPLVRGADADAASVYATWLPHALALRGFHGPCPPARDLLSDEPVRSAAEAIVARVWKEATEGRAGPDGQTFLAPSVAGSVLGSLSPIWARDPAIRAGLLHWTNMPATTALDTRDAWRAIDRATAGLEALVHTSLAVEEFETLSRGVEALFGLGLRRADMAFAYTHAPSILSAVEAIGLAPALTKLLRVLVAAVPPLAPQAAAMLAAQIPEDEARHVSAWTAATTFRVERVLRPGHSLAALVALAPSAWATALRSAIEENLDATVASAFLAVLPSPWRSEVEQAWMATVRSQELPWTAADLATDDAWRPADRVRGLLFDSEREVPPDDR